MRVRHEESLMSILGNILSKVFGRDNAGAKAPSTSPASAAPSFDDVKGGSSSATASTGLAPLTDAEVEALLSNMAAKYSHKVNWRESIVDLMSMLGIDNSLSERRALADELGYTGDKQDTATMNIWLHKQVMRKLAENGGRVPTDLLD